MDFQQLNKIFGGCIFPDANRTNMTEVDERISTLTRFEDDDWREETILLIRVIRSAISGNYVIAERFLSRLRDLAERSRSDRLRHRCEVYEYYINGLKKIPPCLRFRDDRDCGEGILRGIVLSEPVCRARIKNTQSLFEMSEDEMFESHVIQKVSNVHESLWREGFSSHSTHNNAFGRELFRDDRELWRETHTNVGNAGMAGYPGIRSYFRQLDIQYLLAGEAKAIHGNMNVDIVYSFARLDFIQAGNLKILEGDSFHSPPHTSPLELNLISTVRELGWDNETWDTKESNFTLVENKDGYECWKHAEAVFQAAECSRGIGIARLRFCCVKLARALDVAKAGQQRVIDVCLDGVRCDLLSIKELLHGDVTYTLMINGYLVMLDILQDGATCDDYLSIITASYNVGSLGRISKNTSTAQFVGMLMLRFGRRLLLLNDDDMNVRKAMLSCACANICFEALHDPYLQLHAVVASAKVQQRRGHVPIAAKYVTRARKLLQKVLIYFDEIVAKRQASGAGLNDEQLSHDLVMVQTTRTSCITQLDRIAAAVYVTDHDNQRDTAQETKGTLGMSNLGALVKQIDTLAGSLSSETGDAITKGLLDMFGPGLDQLYNAHNDFQDTVRSYQNEMLVRADVDAAEGHLWGLLERLEDFPGPGTSRTVDTLKITALQYLGEFDKARRLLDQAIPARFSGSVDHEMDSEADLDWKNPRMPSDIGNVMAKYDYSSIASAISLCFISKDWRRGQRVLDQVLRVLPNYVEEIIFSNDPDRWFDIVRIAAIWEHNSHFGQAFELYLAAFEVVEGQRRRLADSKDRRAIYSSINAGEIFHGLARLALRFCEAPNNISLGSKAEKWSLTASQWMDQAVRFLELGRSRTLLDLLISARIAPEEFSEWSVYSYNLRLEEALKSTTSDDPPSVSNENNARPSKKRSIATAVAELQAELNSQSLSKLAPHSQLVSDGNQGLYECIPKNAIVLHFSTGRDVMLLLCITHQGVIDVQSFAITNRDIAVAVLRFNKLLRSVSSGHQTSLPSLKECEEHIERISCAILMPVERHIDSKEHIIFAADSLGKFPVSTLSYHGKPLFLSKDVSSIPSLAALQHFAEKKASSNSKFDILFQNETGRQPLDISTSAALSTARRVKGQPHQANELDPKALRDLYAGSDVMLIAAHGEQSEKSAWESSLLLQPPLKVLDLARMHSNASLVVFEACVSGLGEDTGGSDLIGFSHAVLASGASAFLGGLWKVSDEASALLMTFLFEELATAGGSKSLARCWRKAQMRLYDLDTKGAVEILRRILKDCGTSEKRGWITPDHALRLQKALRFTIQDIEVEGVDFKHPFFWGGFVLIGHGGLVI